MRRVFVTGDTHQMRDIDKLKDENFTQQKELTKEDILIICGDAGVTWDETWRTRHCVEFFESRNFTTLFVDGNHENFINLYKYPIVEMFCGKVRQISESIFHLMRGEVYTINGRTFFCMGGAYSIDKENRIPGKQWWPEELPSVIELKNARKNLVRYDNKVDYIITHDCSTDNAKKINSHKVNHMVEEEWDLKKFFEYLELQVEYTHWFFGHHHTDKCIDPKHTAIFENIIEINF